MSRRKTSTGRYPDPKIATQDDSKRMLWDYETLPVINCWTGETGRGQAHISSTIIEQFNGYTTYVRLPAAAAAGLRGYLFISEDQS